MRSIGKVYIMVRGNKFMTKCAFCGKKLKTPRSCGKCGRRACKEHTSSSVVGSGNVCGDCARSQNSGMYGIHRI